MCLAEHLQICEQMETPPPNLELSTSQLTSASAAAAWHVLGLLLSQGRPARPSELASSSSLFYPTPDFIRFLCSIPNSPLRFVDNHFVTFSQIGVAAIAQFFANSNLITGYLDLLQSVPRLSPNVRSNGIVRTYCRKRKRPIPEVEDFRQMKKKSCFQDFDEERNPNQSVMKMPSGFQSVYTQGIETLSSLSSLLDYDGWKFERIIFSSPVFRKSMSGQFNFEIENVEHEPNESEVEIPNTERLFSVHQKSCKSYSLIRGGSSHTRRVVAEELLNCVPLPEPSHSPYIMGNSEESRTGDVEIVKPINSMNICTSKLEVDEQMIVTQEKSEAVIQGCESLNEDVNGITESLNEDVNGITNEVPLHDSGGCKDHKENQLVARTYKHGYCIDNPKKTLRESNNKAQFLVKPRTKGNLQSQGEMVNHLIKHSPILKPDHKDEAYDRKKAICLTMENCKGLPDKGPGHFKRDGNPTSEKQTTKFNFERNIDTKEKREMSMENRKQASSISNSIEQIPFPNFESFIVEEEEGSGGYGTVYRARRKADGVIFAIKCPHVNANRNYVSNEMKMLERLGGKNFVIKYEGSFKSGSADCLVLEHVEHDRPEILKREMNITDIQWYGYCLFKALAGLHKQGIVHRDVKPGNFLYSRKVKKGYLIDFNLALDMRKKYGTIDNSRARHNLNDPLAVPRTKSLPPAKSRKLMNTTFEDAINKNVGRVSKSILPPGNLKKKVDKAKLFTDASSRNIIKSQGADGSGITSAKDATSTRTLSAEKLREPLPSRGRKELLSLVQEALQGGNHESVNAPKSKRKRVAAPAGDVDCKFLYTTPMPLHANGIAIRGAGLLKSKGDAKPRREGPCVGTKGFKAPEVLFRSLHQGPKADIWSAGVTLLYLMIGRTPFIGDTDQNIKEIAKLRGSEDLWEVAKLHDHESLFPKDLLDVKYLSPINLRDWCARNIRRPGFFDVIPRSLFDLVDKCLMVNPRHRISAEEALRHDFFTPCHEALGKHRLQRQGLSLDAGSKLLLHGESETWESELEISG